VVGKALLARKADNLTAMWADCLENVWSSIYRNPIGLHCLLQGERYFFYFEISFHWFWKTRPVDISVVPVYTSHILFLLLRQYQGTQ
jgi:hypothetical protein